MLLFSDSTCASYVGGISQTADSIGFEHITLTPPATLIQQAADHDVTPNSTISTPLKWTTAAHKTLRGQIELQVRECVMDPARVHCMVLGV